MNKNTPTKKDTRNGSIVEVKTALKSLPAYFGGKRKIIEKIFDKRLPHNGKLIDPMSGAMTIPLSAKILGYNVVANDRSLGSYIIGKALIENETYKIDLSILPKLIKRSSHSDKFVATNFGDVHLPKKLAVYSDNIYGHITQMKEDEKWVYMLLLYRFLTFMAPYNLYRYPGLTKGWLNDSFPASMQLHINKWNKNILDPIPALEKMATQINNAIFSGTGTVVQQDVFEFMDDNSGDILYFDPPYAGAGVPYEKGYEVIEQMMERSITTRDVSVFNDLSKERDMLKTILAHGKNYSHIVFSYWTQIHDRDWFAELFKEVGLNFEEISLGNYSYTYSTKVGKKGSWKAGKDKGTKEILFLLNP